uniref:HAD hydrolase, family IA, variant 3 n=1 Tax=Panagrellus redivivus TaxID=6233 RepID=A0A7E4VQZ1_PANRE
MPTITHVIFDYDGILQNTEQAYYDAYDAALKKHGRSFNNVLKHSIMGRKRHEAFDHILSEVGLTGKITHEEFGRDHDVVLDAIVAQTPLLPGAEKLTDHLIKHGIHVAICTGSNNEEFAFKTVNFKDFVAKFPVKVLSGSDPEVKRGKPAPDPYLVTMKRFAVPPKSAANVLVFEDSINGARSGIAAGCATIFIPQKEFITHDWAERTADVQQQASEVLTSLEEFDPVKYGIPGY